MQQTQGERKGSSRYSRPGPRALEEQTPWEMGLPKQGWAPSTGNLPSGTRRKHPRQGSGAGRLFLSCSAHPGHAGRDTKRLVAGAIFPGGCSHPPAHSTATRYLKNLCLSHCSQQQGAQGLGHTTAENGTERAAVRGRGLQDTKPSLLSAGGIQTTGFALLIYQPCYAFK